jgi:hypothetical protein
MVGFFAAAGAAESAQKLETMSWEGELAGAAEELAHLAGEIDRIQASLTTLVAETCV